MKKFNFDLERSLGHANKLSAIECYKIRDEYHKNIGYYHMQIHQYQEHIKYLEKEAEIYEEVRYRKEKEQENEIKKDSFKTKKAKTHETKH